MRSDFWFTCCFEHMSAIFSILRHKGSFINHVDMVSGREFCQMSICQHKPASLSKMVHKGRGWSIKLPHGFIIIGELVMLNKAFVTFGIFSQGKCNYCLQNNISIRKQTESSRDYMSSHKIF